MAHVGPSTSPHGGSQCRHAAESDSSFGCLSQKRHPPVVRKSCMDACRDASGRVICSNDNRTSASTRRNRRKGVAVASTAPSGASRLFAAMRNLVRYRGVADAGQPRAGQIYGVHGPGRIARKQPCPLFPKSRHSAAALGCLLCARSGNHAAQLSVPSCAESDLGGNGLSSVWCYRSCWLRPRSEEATIWIDRTRR